MPTKKKSSIDIRTVKYIAHLARIDLDTDELKVLSGQLKKIIEFIDTLKELDVSEVPATSHVLALQNVLREDLPKDSLSPDEVLKIAPYRKDNFFVVPKIIE